MIKAMTTRLALVILLSLVQNKLTAQVNSPACSDAVAQQVIVGNTTASLTIGDATVNDPAASGCSIVPTHDGWFWFDATSTNTQIFFDIINTGMSPRDAAIIVYTGACGSLTQIACANNGANNVDENLVLSTTIGTRYRVRILRNTITGGAALSGTLSIWNILGGECSGATNVPQTATYIPVTYSLGNATQSISPINCSRTSTSALDVWFSFIAASSNPTIRVVGPVTFDAVIDLRSGSCNGTNLACADATTDAGTETISTSGLTIGATYFVRVYDYNASGNALPNNQSFTISVYGSCVNPAIYNLTGGGAYCSGGSGVAIGLSGSQTGFSYQLKLNGINNGSPLAGTGSAISFGNKTSAGTYTVEARNDGSSSCTNTMSGNAIISIDQPLAQPSLISGAPVSVCPPLNGVTLSVVNDPGASSYNWYLGTGINGITFSPVSTTNVQTINIGTTVNSTYIIKVDAVNSCGASASRGVMIRRSSSTPASITGEGWACPNNVKTYSHAAVTGATSYQWIAPAGCYFDGVITNTSPYITTNTSVTVKFPVGYTSGTIGVASQVACYTSPYKNIIVNNAPAVPSVITGTSSICPPKAGVPYSVVNTPGLTYSWTTSPGATIFGGHGTSNVTVNYLSGSSSGQLQVAANSSCGKSLPRKLNITITGGVGGNTPRPESIEGKAVNLCGSTSEVYTANPLVAGALYSFNTSVPGTIITPGPATNQATITWPTGWVTSTLSVTQQGSCGAAVSLPRTIDVKARPNSAVITGPVNVAPNSTGVIYSVPPLSSPTVNHIWYVPAGATIVSGQGTNAITVNFGATGGQVKCYQGNSCGSATGVLNVSAPRLAGTASKAEETISFSVYPNPADEYITVQFASVTERNATIQIIDLTGKVVSSTVINTIEGINTNSIEVSTLAKGMYIMNVQTPGGNVQTRIAVQ